MEITEPNRPALPGAISGGRGFTWADRGDAAALLAVLGFAISVVLLFHDRFWWAPDEGAYAHVAGRILRGEVLNLDIQDVHPGLINFANALAFALFGPELVSLRYPLAALTVVQSGLVFGLLRPRGWVIATAGGVGLAALSFVQFLNPTAHWYALFLFVAVLGVLRWMEPHDRRRLLALGFLLGALFLFRQLSGVIAGIGVLTYLLCELPSGQLRGTPFRERLVGRGLLIVMGLGLAAYFVTKADATALALFGVVPLSLIVWATWQTSRTNGDVARMVLLLLVGAVAAVLPLLAYHVVHGSVASWLDDTVAAALSLPGLPFFAEASHGRLLLGVIAVSATVATPAALLNGAYWVAIMLLAPVTAWLTLRRLLRDGPQAGARGVMLPMLASFYAIVAVHFQIPIYLMYAAGLSLVGLLWFAPDRRGLARVGLVCLALGLSAVGLIFQAGQPLSRGFSGITAGARVDVAAAPGVTQAGLRMTGEDSALYEALLALIDREVPEEGAILALPVNPELYYLSGRRNPTRFFNAALGVRSKAELQEVLQILQDDPPALVFHRADDKYNTPHVADMMAFVRTHYTPLAPVGGFAVYRHRPAGP